jgi:hypothetical protein
MGDIWLPGYPPAYTDWGTCLRWLIPLMPSRADAEILAAIGGPESGYDYTVINDTPSTGDYSVGIWQINYLGSLYAERSREFGTPRELIAGGPMMQAHAASSIWHSQGWMAWATTYTSGAWRKYIGSGPIPHPGGPGGGPTLPPPPSFDTKEIDRATRTLRSTGKQLIDQRNALSRVGTRGWRPS